MGTLVGQGVGGIGGAGGIGGTGGIGGGIALCYVRGHGVASGSSTQDGGPRAETG
ncbi:hypothetical protein P376_0888 [Streptomyces sp. HCCB10043]|nr:hypothetical protein P376_0888 [Streptomyces sp. HCCB10043]